MKTRPYEDAIIINYPEGDVSLERPISKYPPSPRVVTHTVLPGETIHSISFQYYGDSAYWMYIADFNNLMFPLGELESGSILQIPL